MMTPEDESTIEIQKASLILTDAMYVNGIEISTGLSAMCGLVIVAMVKYSDRETFDELIDKMKEDYEMGIKSLADG